MAMIDAPPVAAGSIHGESRCSPDPNRVRQRFYRLSREFEPPSWVGQGMVVHGQHVHPSEELHRSRGKGGAQRRINQTVGCSSVCRQGPGSPRLTERSRPLRDDPLFNWIPYNRAGDQRFCLIAFGGANRTSGFLGRMAACRNRPRNRRRDGHGSRGRKHKPAAHRSMTPTQSGGNRFVHPTDTGCSPEKASRGVAIT